MVSVDEMGPIRLRPYSGHSWARPGPPDRVRATCRQNDVVRHFMGMYNYYHHTIRRYISLRNCRADGVRFLQYMR